MAKAIAVAMPQDVDVGEGYTLRIAAIDSASGSAVSGVKISNMTIEVENMTGGDLTSGVFLPFMLVPGPGA